MMSRAEMDRLVADLQRKPDLMLEFRRLASDLEELVCWAAANEYRVLREDLRRLAESDRELSDDELEDAAGGDDGWAPGTPPPPGGGTGGTGTP
jgi:hypothetical protein